MPIRSLRSSVLRWPDARTVIDALRQWAVHAQTCRDDIERIGYMGSYARGESGVGSDLDVIIVLTRSERPFEKRSCEWDLTALPVSADLLVYTAAEWEAVTARGGRFAEAIRHEAVWL